MSFHNVAITRSNSDFDGSNDEGNCGDIKAKNAERNYLFKTNLKLLGFFYLFLCTWLETEFLGSVADSIVFINL